MINMNRLASKSGSSLVKLTGIFLLLYSIVTIIQGFYGLPVSFRQGQFGFRYEVLKDPTAMLITGIVEGFPADRAGLKPGDRIIKVNGQSLDSHSMQKLWGDAVAGSQIVLTVQREDQIMEMELTRKLLPMIDRVIRVLFHLILPALMLAYILVGLWGVFKHSSFITNLIALVCFFFGAMIASVTLSPVLSPLTEILNYYQIKKIVTMICSLLAPAFWLFLFVHFPQKAVFYKKHKYLVTLLIFLLPAALMAFVLFFPEVVETNYFLAIVVFSIFEVTYIVSGVIALSKGAKREKNILKKRQYHLINFGIKYGALSILLGFGCLYIYSFLMTGLAAYVGWMVFFIFLVTQIVGLIVPFTFLNSFFRNKILETESALRRRLRYLGATSALFFIYLLAGFFIGNWIIASLELTDTSFIVLIVLVISITFSPLQNKILRWLDEKLYPEKNKYKNSLKELIKRMSSFIEEAQILENLSRWISETMGIYPIYAVSIDRITVTNIPLKIHSPRSVLQKTKSGANFYWDEIPEEASDIIEEDEKRWALQKGISITVPMISRGEQVGILSIGKKKNNEDFNGDDLEIFQEAAQHTALAIQNIKLQSEHLEKKRLDKELEVARNIQNQLMPRQIPEIKGLQIYGENQPCFEVGGDYFDIIPIDEHKTALVIADVSGKGAGAALLMSNLQASLHMAISVALPLKEIVYKINNIIFDNSLPSQFITFFIGVWDQESKSLQYINAGHNPPFILRTNNRIKKLSTTGIALGIKANQVYKCQGIGLATNEILVIYTDGIEEFFNYQLEAFGVERMIKTFKENKHSHPKEIIQKLFKKLKNFAGGKESYHCDDLTIIVIKRID
ncbi:MAG: SpoIIE family protein phosphatase [Candidatus Aminicenantes bacterium]|jgi:serine phosphatase RsbU (regulator of sigma subunit)